MTRAHHATTDEAAETSDQRWTDRLLNPMRWSGLAMSVAGLTVTLVIFLMETRVRVGGILLTLSGALTLAFACTGSAVAAARTMVWSMLLGAGVAALSDGGLSNPAVVIGVPLALGIAGLTLQRRDTVLVIGAAIAITLGLFALEITAHTTPTDGFPPSISTIAILTASALAVLFATRTAGTIRSQLKIIDSGRAQLAVSNAELAARETRWMLGSQAARIAAFEWDFSRNRALWSPGAGRALAYPTGEPPMQRGALLACVHRDDRRALIQAFVAAARGGASGRIACAFRALCPDGEVRWLKLKGNAQAMGTCDAGRPRISLFCVLTDETEAKRAQREVEFLAYHDPLTKLLNRQAGLEQLRVLIANARACDTEIALLFINGEEFKRINSNFGESTGNEVLRGLATRLTSAAPRPTLVFHLGGDRFAAAFGASRFDADLQRTCERLQAYLAEPFLIDGQIIRVSTGIGVALHPRDADTADTLLEKARAAMRQASLAKDCKLRFFDARTEQDQQVYLETRDALRTGIERGEFALVYQPQINLRTGAVVGAEALLRWNRPGHGRVEPSGFMEAAERSGLIVPIGRWVLARACQEAASWGEIDPKGPRVSVNLSAAQFSHAGLADDVMAALRASGLPAERIELELTESLLLADEASTRATLERWKTQGFRLALDDFGTGYSSMSYLDRFDLDVIKIDQTFVRTIEPGNRPAVLCESIVRLAHRLGLQVVAEGIETREQLAFLIGIGCDIGQGYLFSRPVPPEAFRALLASSRSERTQARWLAEYETTLQALTPAPRGSIAVQAPSGPVPASARALIVDDDATSIALLRHLLRLADFDRITAVQDPRDASAAFDAERPDLVLLDIHMPELDGFAVLDQLRALDPHHRSAVIIVTGDTGQATARRAAAAGVFDLVRRPIDTDEMLIKMRSVRACCTARGALPSLP